MFKQIEPARYQRPLFILDLAVPRDFEPAIGDRLGVYLYSIDDLQAACERNRRERDQELPAAIHIVEQETARFMAELHHRATAPIIKRLQGRLAAAEGRRAASGCSTSCPSWTSGPATRSASPSTGWSTSSCTRRWNRCAAKPKKGRRTACSTRSSGCSS